MLDTSELEFIFATTYSEWVDEHEGQENQSGLLCDCCALPSTDGCLYNIPGGEDDRELLVCHPCFMRIYGAAVTGGSESWGDSYRIM